jgi:hypothetical protein
MPVGEAGERTLVFLSDIVAGLRIYDATDPQAPVLLASLHPNSATCPAGFYADNVRLLGTRAYLAGGNCGVLVIDVSDPSAPELVLRVSSPSYAKDALPRSVPGGVELLVADYFAGLRVIEIPEQGGAPGFEQRFLLGPAQGITGSPVAVDADPVSGIVAVATTEGLSTVSFDGDVPRAGPYVVIPAADRQRTIPQDVTVRDDYAYVPLWQGGLVVIDLLDASMPTPFGIPTVDTSHAFFKALVSSSGTTLLASEGQCGLAVFDVTVSDRGSEGLVEREGSPIAVAGTDPGACGPQVTDPQIPFAWSLAELDGLAAVGFGAMAGGGGFELLGPEPQPVAEAPPPPTDGDPDLDGDGVVGTPDLLQLARAFGAAVGDARYDARADLDRDGVVGVPDLIRLAGAFGRAPGS